jgi:hypothetical protein
VWLKITLPIVEGFKTSFKFLLGTLKIMDTEIERFEHR